MHSKPMYFKNIPKFPGHCPIFTEVIAKKNIKQTDKFRTTMKLRSFQQKNYQNRSILRKNIREQTLKIIDTDELYNLLLWKVG